MRRLVLGILIFTSLLGGLKVSASEADNVIVLANANDPDSVKLARYYAGRRGVPEANIIALKLSADETIGWHEFVRTLFQPLQDELVRDGWISGIGMDLTDALGRKRYAMDGHKISYLVVCRGVPLRVVGDADMPPDDEQVPATFRTSTAAVDSELALLAQSGTPICGFVRNPLFANDHPSDMDLGAVVRVSRLDGPTYDDARGLVDRAIAAEQTGLIGRSYIDMGGPFAQGDGWLAASEKQLEALGFDGDVDRSPGTFPEWARFDAPAIYFGWYAENLNGPFAAPGFRFPPGAIALHIHSYSATTVRSATARWVGPLVARGVTATFGNVAEPYLQFTHQPQLLLKALARGDTLGQAAAYSIPAYSWEGVVIGDPLYRPFKVSFGQQWENLGKLPEELRPYVVLRRMRLLDAQGKRNEAIWTGLGELKQHPSLAVALATAELQKAFGDADGAQMTLGAVVRQRSYSFAEAPLAVIAARRLQEAGKAADALQIWQGVLVTPSLSKDVRLEWLKNAIAAAQAGHDDDLAARWQAQLNELTASPKS